MPKENDDFIALCISGTAVAFMVLFLVLAQCNPYHDDDDGFSGGAL